MCLTTGGSKAFLTRLLVLSVWLLAVSTKEITNFVAYNTLKDGEVETRIYYNHITAKETSVSKGSDDNIKFRQLANGRALLQLIYVNETIKDCQIVRKRDQVKTFLKKFKDDLSHLVSTSNITVVSLDSKSLPRHLKAWFHFSKLRDLCKKNHKKVKRVVHRMQDRKNKEAEKAPRSGRFRNEDSLMTDLFIAPGTLWCGHHDRAKGYGRLGTLSKTDLCCRRHDQCDMNINGFSKKYGLYNPKPFTISYCNCDSRNRQDVSEVLRFPGTRWCGKGSSATKYTHVGELSRTDKCCRYHDLACPFSISGFTTKYGLFNWRVNTLMHCNCDERFRACLKVVDTSDSNLVGKIFFNVVQTKCFVLKPKKVCVKHAWWGEGCEQYVYEKQAILRDNMSY